MREHPALIQGVALQHSSGPTPPTRDSSRPLTNLPHQLTSFVGRETDIAEVQRLLSTTRLLTLTGPGGVGKTLLALQIAEPLLPRFPEGVWIVDLAAVAEPAQ